ncbi:MAG: phenylalanine--tRNA ligase subunit beta [Porticoccaceae bacterium]|jgi:phenylalanyl-tRNA synthetase beta chain|nr:phenylalanine--tRNA ligase subunit beta [Porticoccaceae bacterium]
MKFSESWLREWVNPPVDSAELVSRLTMAGLEVDSVEPVAPPFDGVVVGEIIAIAPHPDADKLRVCQVAGGAEGPVQVVCGAPNARQGLKVAFATLGATLPGDFRIRRAKLRGVESFGMLCAEKELGVSDADAGLWELPAEAPVGENLRDYLDLDDNLIEVDLTPNRGDCLSINGLAREVGVLCNIGVAVPPTAPVAAVRDDSFPVRLDAGGRCPRYAGRVIRGVDISRPSPRWLVEKLARSGVRSIDGVVDVTNFVLLELGQPMHAFDLARLSGGIRVRTSRAGEEIVLLDDSKRTLNEGTLLITDESGPIALAGIMGGAATAVSATTRDIFLESAFFDPMAVVGQARQYGLHTDSSHRFERGVDPELCRLAIERATALLVEIVGGEPGPVVVSELPDDLPEVRTLRLRRARLARQLACDLDEGTVTGIFARLGCEVLEADAEGWTVRVPSWRFDIAIEVDLIEEIARVHGYNNLPSRVLAAPIAIAPRDESRLPVARLRHELAARGFREAITYSFVDPKVQQLVDPDARPVEVANPISSDMAVMRTSLWAGLIPVLARNLNRQQSRIYLFETGLRFVEDAGGELAQEPMIAGLIQGERHVEGWTGGKERVDFYDLKGHVEALLQLGGEPEAYRFVPASHPALHPGQSAALWRGAELVGHLGRLHPGVQKQLDIDHPVYLFELRLAPLRQAAVPRFREISRFPGVRRDIAVLVDEAVPAQALLDAVRGAAGDLLSELRIFDVYQGKGVETTRKSVAMSLTFQDESRTLNEAEIAAAMDAVVAALNDKFQGTLRG